MLLPNPLIFLFLKFLIVKVSLTQTLCKFFYFHLPIEEKTKIKSFCSFTLCFFSLALKIVTLVKNGGILLTIKENQLGYWRDNYVSGR